MSSPASRGDTGSRGRGRGRGRGERGKGGRSDAKEERGSSARQPSNGEGSSNGDRARGKGTSSPIPARKAEQTAALEALRVATRGSISDESLIEELKAARYDVVEAVASLNKKRQGSWASLAAGKKLEPFVVPDSYAKPERQQQQRKPRAPKNGNKSLSTSEESVEPPRSFASTPSPAPAPVAPVVEPDADPDEKIQQLSAQFQTTLREIETKQEKLRSIYQEVQTISGPRDAAIINLQNERETLLMRQQQMRDEIRRIDTRVAEIDIEVERLKKEKASLVKALEEKSKSILGGLAH